jgi:hypothetical protein
MDARARLRFQDNRQLLESWISANRILGVKQAVGEAVASEPPVEAFGEPRTARVDSGVSP